MNMSTHCAHRNTNYGHVKNEIGPRDERAADKWREMLVFASEKICLSHVASTLAIVTLAAVPSTKRTKQRNKWDQVNGHQFPKMMTNTILRCRIFLIRSELSVENHWMKFIVSIPICIKVYRGRLMFTKWDSIFNIQFSIGLPRRNQSKIDKLVSIWTNHLPTHPNIELRCKVAFYWSFKLVKFRISCDIFPKVMRRK